MSSRIQEMHIHSLIHIRVPLAFYQKHSRPMGWKHPQLSHSLWGKATWSSKTGSSSSSSVEFVWPWADCLRSLSCSLMTCTISIIILRNIALSIDLFSSCFSAIILASRASISLQEMIWNVWTWDWRSFDPKKNDLVSSVSRKTTCRTKRAGSRQFWAISFKSITPSDSVRLPMLIFWFLDFANAFDKQKWFFLTCVPPNKHPGHGTKNVTGPLFGENPCLFVWRGKPTGIQENYVLAVLIVIIYMAGDRMTMTVLNLWQKPRLYGGIWIRMVKGDI